MTKTQLFFLAISFYALAGCQTISDSELPTPIVVSPTTTLQPTNTAQPTNTPKPTSTPVISTSTIAPPDVLTKYLANVRVVKVDSFDNGSRWESSAVISDGVLKLIGIGGDDWLGTAYNKRFHEGEGLVVNFKFTQRSYFGMYLENGNWDTVPYKRFGMDIRKNNVESNLFIGKDSLGFTSLPGNFYPFSDTWYSFFMVSGKNGDFLALLWDPSNPEKTVIYRDKLENWGGLTWTFRTQVNEGTIIFDDFEEIEFDGIK